MTVDLPEYSGCVWPADFGPHQEVWDGYDTAQQDTALALASFTLQRLTAYRVGECPIKLRPCLSTPLSALHSAPYAGLGSPVDWNGAWYNACHCQGSCRCETTCEISLPPPVGRIDEVKCDGDVVDPDDYATMGNVLVWRGAGDCPFVLGQDMSKPDTEPGTMSVTYLNAFPVDALGAYACGLLALQYAAAWTGKGKCYLPANVTSIVRQGVAMEIISGAFPNGLTGIREIDTWLQSWNPGRLTHAATIYSPDMPMHRVES